MEISAKKKDSPTVITVNYEFPENLKDLAAKFGDAVVYGKAMDSLVIDVQAMVRRHMTDSVDAKGVVTSKAKTQDEIQALVKAWVPGVGAVRRSPVEKVGTLIAQMSPEEKKALLAQLKAA
jgi:hypothetical protein